MLTANDTPRRDALRSLAASGLALFGLCQALDAGAAKNARAAKKKSKGKQGPPGPRGPAGPPGPAGPAGPSGTPLTVERGSTFNFIVTGPGSDSATSQCFGNGVAVSGMITMASNGAGCTVTKSQQVTSPNGWTMTVTCADGASSDNHLTALCVHS
jgi:hypothetical protein